MILDSLENSQQYYALHPIFEKAFNFIRHTDFTQLEEGKIELTILEWDKVVSLNPKFWHVYHNLGSLFYKQGKLDQAMAYWTKAVALMLFSF